MLNNIESVMKKRKELNIKIAISSSLFILYFYYYLSKGSKIWFLYSVFVLFIMFAMLREILKVEVDKLKADSFNDDEFESTSTIEYPIATFMVNYVGLAYISISILKTIYEKSYGLRNLQLIIYVFAVILFILLSIYFVKEYTKLHTLIYKNGLRIYCGDILFTDIKKYNFLKLKKSGYSFEINLGGEYHRFKVSEEQKLRISELLIEHGVA